MHVSMIFVMQKGEITMSGYSVFRQIRIAKPAHCFAARAAILAMLCFAFIPIDQAQARCIRQSLMNHDYCGAEGAKLIGNVPDRLIGEFKGACAGHDACYSLGAEQIVVHMERRFQQNMLSATRSQKSEFAGEMAQVKRDCDTRFLAGLNYACERVAPALQSSCRLAARTYYRGVDVFGARSFNQTFDEAFTCRTS